MKVVILAGGYGTRISEESMFRPKPMIEVGGMPILWHIMNEFSFYGFHEFLVCAGYKQHMIKEWFANYYLYNSDVTFDFANRNDVIIHNNKVEPWKVSVVDTGIDTLTGGRIKRIQDYVGNETFMMTYGDGVSDVNISEWLEFHRKDNNFATLTAVQPDGRFGILDISGDKVASFREKNRKDTGWINGGYMVLEPEGFQYIEGDMTTFEKEPLEKLANENKLGCYRHDGFWQCMDTMRDREKLEELWSSGKAPWKLW